MSGMEFTLDTNLSGTAHPSIPDLNYLYVTATVDSARHGSLAGYVTAEFSALVLAAPDLLEALRELLKHAGIADAAAEDIDGEDHARESRARAAIAAAEGKQS